MFVYKAIPKHAHSCTIAAVPLLRSYLEYCSNAHFFLFFHAQIQCGTLITFLSYGSCLVKSLLQSLLRVWYELNNKTKTPLNRRTVAFTYAS